MQRTVLRGTATRRPRCRARAGGSRSRILTGRGSSRLLLAAVIAPALCMVSDSSGAQLAQAQRPVLGLPVLGLQEALAKALGENREIAAFAHRLEEQEGRLVQAGLVANPELKLVIEDAAGSGIFSGYQRAQTTLALEWVFEHRVRGRRVAAAQAGSALLGSDAQVLRLDVAAETAQRFLTSLANQVRLTSAGEAVSLAEDTVASVKRRVEAGKAPSAELWRAEAELARAALARDDVEHELASAYHRLAAQWGETMPAFERVSGELLTLPRVEPFAALTERIDQNPQLVRFVSEARVAKANLLLAEARRWPTIRPTLGVRHYQATDDTALVAELKIPLPVFGRNQGRVSESRAALARTNAEADAARVRVHTALFEVYEELQHHIHRANTLRDDVSPRLTAALTETRRGYEKGRYSYLEWRALQADLLAASNALIEASTGAHRLVIELERLTGQRVARR
jgi:cobalt-zinc-cadmium efflux system outer membrane protein